MRRILAVVLGWMLLSSAGAAEHRGVLRGQVVDGAGRPVGDVVVTVESEATSGKRTTRTDSTGRFTVPELDAGSYRVSVADDRFTSFVARAEIRTNETTDVPLQPAQPATSAAADYRPFFQYIDRSSASFRTRFEQPFISALPLDGRSLTDLVALTPGLTTSPAGPVAGGTQSTSSAYLTNGVASFDPLFNTPVLNPLPESTAELTVMTLPLEASLGRTAGAQTILVTMSGTNTFRGLGFGFVQREVDRLQAGGSAGGPIRRGSTYFFADLGFTDQEQTGIEADPFTQVSGRVDQTLGLGRLTARYAIGRGGRVDRQADQLGVTFVHQLSDRLVNDARFGFVQLAFDERWAGVLPEFDAIEAADVVTFSTGSHLVSGGVEYFGFAPGEIWALSEETTISAFVQDRWRATSRISVTGGIRLDRVSRDAGGESGDESSLVSPRAGMVWALGERGHHVVRGDYGRHLQSDGSSVDAWTAGVQRQWGRLRTLEAAYLGSRTDDEFTGFGSNARYDALRVQLQQRSETAISAHVGYTYGRWTIESARVDERVRASLDSRHKLSAAFSWRLPFGADSRWFTGGWSEKVFGGLQLAGIAVTQTGRPRIDRNAPQGPTWRTLDLALTKTIGLGGTSLELRAELFNASDRENPRPPVLGTGLEELLADEARGRRFQFGGRFRF